MKTVLNLQNNNVMKNAIKYICALLLLVGVNVNAWGVTITLKAWNKSTSSYVDIGTFEKGNKPGDGVGTHSDGYLSVIAWAPGTQTTDTSFPTNGGGNNGSTYYNQYGYPNQYYNGDATILYAVYSYGGYYTTAPDVQFTELLDCTPLSKPTGLSLTENADATHGKTRFGWNAVTNASGYVLTVTKDGTITQSYNRTAEQLYMKGDLPTGNYTWSVYAKGDGETYCAVNESEEGTSFCIGADLSEVTPSNLAASSITNSAARISWNAVSGAATYQLLIVDEKEKTIDAYDGSSTLWDVTGLTAGTTYTIWWQAINSCDDGYNSAIDKTISFTTLAEYDIELAKNNSEAGSEDGLATVVQNAASLSEIEHATNTNSGYHLDGYYTNDATPVKVLEADGSFAATDVTGYITDGKWSNTSDDVTLYAHWALNTYTVSFNANGGSGSMDGVEKDYGSSYALPACGFTAPSGKVFDGWAEGSAGGTKRTLPYDHTVTGNITFYALWRDASYTDYVFSCAELTLTPKLVTADAPMFITSAAGKKVRSQDSILIVGSGLTPGQTLTFPDLPAKFEIKSRTGAALATDASGAINAVAYIFYTPAVGDTDDGLDELTGITVSVGGAKPKTVNLTQDIIGRHLPADFVIAAKKDGKWWALPSDMASTTNPKPSEIAVNDINNPSVAYTDASNKYGLAAPTASNISGGNGQYIRLTMSIEDGNDPAGPAPLFGSATGTRTLGKSNNAKATSDLSAGWWWQLKQTNTSITNPQDAKYTIYCANNTSSLSLRDNAGNPDWGLFASGVEELRLIPASSVVFTEAEIVAWGHHNAIVEVDKANAGGTGVAAEKVKALLNGAESSLITLAETKTSNGTGATKYDYTVAFGDVIDFAANEGQMLTLEWYNSSDVMIAVSNIIVPTIVASDITINKTNYSLKSAWNTEVHVLPNVTVTVDASAYDNSDVTIKELNIYPGATVNVTTGTLKATTLVMRNGWNRLNGDKKYDVARLYITPTNGNLQATNAYADWYIDFDQYYPIAVPWEVDLSVNDGSKIWYKNTKSKALIGTTTGSVRLRYYDGASRAANVQVGVGESANWKLYGDDGCNPIPVKLEPSKAYAMTAKRPAGKAFSIIRMPLTIPSAAWTTGGEKGVLESTHKDQVTVLAYGDASTPSYAKGWNFIANPYMSLYKGALSYTDEGAIEYANIPDIDFQEYDQVPIVSTKLKPASGFLIQAPKNGTVTFGEVNRQASAPSYRKEVADETMPIQRAYITLAGDGAEDMMGILVGENYTAEYETNADLAKLLSNSNTLRTYMYYGEQNMAYLAISPVLAQEWIPVQVRIPVEGEYTFSLDNASVVENLEGVYLIDYANNDQITNLIEENYTFITSAGTINGRFAINAVVGTRQTPTAIDVIGEGNKGNGPVKFIYHENVYIWHNGIIYDATGKKVK